MDAIYKKCLPLQLILLFLIIRTNYFKASSLAIIYFLTASISFAFITTEGHLRVEEEIEYITGDFLADISGFWSEPNVWRQFDGNEFGAYGAAGVPGKEHTVYIKGNNGVKTIITCTTNREVNHLNLLPESEIHLLQSESTIVLGIFGSFKSWQNTLINSNRAGNFYELKGTSVQDLEISGSLGTNTHVSISGIEVLLKKDISLTMPSSTLRIEGGTLNFNNFNVVGIGNFRLNNGSLKITAPEGINPKVIPAGADPDLVNRGNIQNGGARDFDNAATYWYTGQSEQWTGYIFGDGSTAKKIIIDNPEVVRLSKSTGISPQGKLEILKGTFEETNEAHVNGTGILSMAINTTYRTSKLNDNLPILNVVNLSPGSTIELFATQGTQRIKGTINYRNLTFSGGGIKRISTATSNINGTVIIKDNAILDVENNAFGGENTNFTMTGGMFRTSKLNDAQPNMNGTYNLSGGTIEFYGTTSNNTQTLRGGKGYHNVNITSNEANTNVNNVSFGSGISSISGTFKISAPSVFQIGGGLGQYLTGPGSFVLEEGATLKYGNVNGITTASCGIGEECGNIRTVTRTFPENASYGFVGSSIGMVSGNGLPASVINLYVQRNLPVTLLQHLRVQERIIFSETGNLLTNDKIITLSSTGRITEIESARLVGIITTTRNVDFASDFGGIGFEVMEAQNKMGITTLTRTTGIAIIGDEGNESILRYFEVLPTGVAINAKIRFRYFHGELNGITEGNLQLFQADVINGPWDVKGGNVNEPQNYIVENYINDFNFITAASSIRPLPVEIISFTGEIHGAGAILSWITASEKDNDFFTIEKSNNLSDFYEIGRITGSGTSLLPIEYSFTDTEFKYSSYYRLKQTDYNHDFSYSEPILLKNTNTYSSISIFPNPVFEEITISFDDPDLMEKAFYIALFDSYGNEIVAGNLIIPAFNLSLNEILPSLKAGIYFITIKTSDTVFKSKFIRL
ncbi:MAG: T9SS type A sorting domain-containing protein [Bacteroidota bacterium]|nr:T9SS type A sorting domain-containing protein [Bacteroidota bacterium]